MATTVPVRVSGKSATPDVPSHHGPRMLAGDPLRAVAALSVLAYHIVTVSVSQADTTPREAFGNVAGSLLLALQLGLYIFFALTGYLLSRAFLRAFVDAEPWPNVRRYLRNRALRILPAFWILLLIALVVLGAAGSSPKQIVATFALLQIWVPNGFSARFAQAWSIHVEAVFYVFLPIAVVFVARCFGRCEPRRRFGVAVLSVLSLWGIGLVLCVVGPPIAFTICAFVPGLALAVAELRLPSRCAARPNAARHSASAMLTLCVLPLALFAFVPVTHYASRAILSTVGIGLLLGAVLVRQWADGSTWRVLDNRPMRWIGVRAYSVYLIHFVLLLEFASALGLRGVMSNMLALAGLGIGATLALSAVSFRWFEQPFLARRARA